jgi:hypothetical protein
MADSPSPRSPQSTAGQSTRHLLDELDALMQRMLAVPVQAADNEPAQPADLGQEAAAPQPRHVELVPAPIAVSAIPAAATEPAPPEPPSGLPLMPIILKRPKGAAVDMPAFPRMQAPPQQRKPGPAAAPVPSAPTAPESLPNPRPAWMNPTAPKFSPPPPTTSWATNLLVVLNRTYDRLTDWLGPLGRWLRSEQGRAVLGRSGLAMLAGALAWAAFRFLG